MDKPNTKLVPVADSDAMGLPWGRRTTGRRMKDDPDFPPVYKINGRGYVEADRLEEYKKKLMARAAASSNAEAA